ncbi:uncharacterized protein [Montipora foliosa]|uniref:uncharacterized protein n=1 Tax=Montipora foliosa TaxID=591990 RepID=UPI0035F1DABB
MHVFRILNNHLRKHNKEVFIWVAYSQSNEGSKVQAKYGVGEQTALLVVVPSQIPQCVDILNETNINEGRVQEPLVNALQMFSHLKRKGINLTRTSSSHEKAMKESLVITENSEVEVDWLRLNELDCFSLGGLDWFGLAGLNYLDWPDWIGSDLPGLDCFSLGGLDWFGLAGLNNLDWRIGLVPPAQTGLFQTGRTGLVRTGWTE